MFYRLNLERASITAIAGTEQAYGSPTVSPDGLWLAYDGPTGDGDGSGIWLVRLDGSHPGKLIDPNESDFCPTWLPDGRLLFLRWRIASDGTRPTNLIYVMNMDGSGEELVTIGLKPGRYWCPLSVMR
jgi:Tol biopolymer transport system component